MQKSRVFLIRHCEPEGHHQMVFNGHNDAPLVGEGFSQAKQLKKRFEGELIHLIYSSPLIRARHTAELVFGQKADIRIEKDLIERFFGELEGVRLRDAMKKHNVAQAIYQGRARAVLPGVESLTDVRERAHKIFKKIIAAHPGKNIVIVGHVMWIKSLLAGILDLPISRMHDVGRVGTSSVTVLDVKYTKSNKPKKMDVLKVGDLTHLVKK